MQKWRKSISFLLRLIIIFLLILPLGIALSKQWSEVNNSLSSLQWNILLLGLIVLIVGHPLMGLISWFVLRYLGEKKSIFQIIGIYYLSQLAKYIPGGIWAFPGRVIAYQMVNVKAVNSVVSVMREVSALFLGAAILGLLGLIQGLEIVGWIRNAIIAGIATCMVVIVVTQIPVFWRLLAKFPITKKTSMVYLTDQKTGLTNYLWFIVVIFISLGFWIFAGYGFCFIVRSVNPNLYGFNWLQLSSIFSLAWCAGFVVIIAPAGVGIREMALTLLLSTRTSSEDALSIALLARLWWTIAESIYILIFGSLSIRSDYWPKFIKPRGN